MDWFTREHHCTWVDRSDYCQVQMSFSLLEALTKTNQNKQTKPKQTKTTKKNHKKRKGMFYFSSGQQSSRDWFQSNKRCQSPPQMQSSLDTDCSRPFHGNQESHPCSFFIFIFSSCMYLPCSTWAGAWRQQAGRKQNCVVIARHRPDPSHFIVLPA